MGASSRPRPRHLPLIVLSCDPTLPASPISYTVSLACIYTVGPGSTHAGPLHSLAWLHVSYTVYTTLSVSG